MIENNNTSNVSWIDVFPQDQVSIQGRENLRTYLVGVVDIPLRSTDSIQRNIVI